MDRSNGAAGSASKCKPLQAEVIPVVDQVQVSIPLATAAEFWNLTQGIVNETGSGARTGMCEARLQIAMTLFLERVVASGVSARLARAAMAPVWLPKIRIPVVSLPQPIDSPSRPLRT